jgi:hypothetical protein
VRASTRAFISRYSGRGGSTASATLRATSCHLTPVSGLREASDDGEEPSGPIVRPRGHPCGRIPALWNSRPESGGAGVSAIESGPTPARGDAGRCYHIARMFWRHVHLGVIVQPFFEKVLDGELARFDIRAGFKLVEQASQLAFGLLFVPLNGVPFLALLSRVGIAAEIDYDRPRILAALFSGSPSFVYASRFVDRYFLICILLLHFSEQYLASRDLVVKSDLHPSQPTSRLLARSKLAITA